ncbi:uncharacterized protein LOC103512929 [Diaphorina citri]|uniref:Uncharacterized protein LOC103512929 n=1 Tax=Diaphorina citri TaxID=121845 RepID=A0A3Q0J547_DIACI|nr:uncharacterized protein LOC103512929 [Diaphorina citri]
MKNKGNRGTTTYRAGTAYKKLTSEPKKESNPGPEEKKKPIITDHINENEGFAGWLSSDDGIGTMKMFVMANSIVMLLTMGWPYLYQLLNYIHDSNGKSPVQLY